MDRALLFVLCFLMSTGAMPKNKGVMEYCQSEVFRPTCPDGHVIVIRSSRYGRLRLGRCLSQNFGYVGCTNDVLAIMSAACSGRRRCEVTIDEAVFHIERPCHKDLKSYLEVSYECVPVISPRPGSCRSDEPTVVTRPGGHLASIVTTETGCGSVDSPWEVRLAAGQRIRVYLLDYGYGVAHNGSEHGLPGANLPGMPPCTVFATIREPSQVKSMTVCSGRERERLVYTSKGRTIEIRAHRGKDLTQPQFILRYEAIGCAAPRAPVYGWAKQAGDRASAGCRHSNLNWDLHCVNAEWKGPNNTCPGASGDRNTSNTHIGEEGQSLPHGVAFAVIISIAFLIGVIVLIMGLLFIKCKPVRRRRKESKKIPPPPTQHFHRPGFDRRVLKITMDGRVARSSAEEAAACENEYAKMKCLVCPQEALLDDNTVNHVHEAYADYGTAIHHGCPACGKCHLREHLYISPGIEETHFQESAQPDIVSSDPDKHGDSASDLIIADSPRKPNSQDVPQVYFFNNPQGTLQNPRTIDRQLRKYSVPST